MRISIIILLLVLTSITLTQCYVCEKCYVPKNAEDNKETTFSIEGMNISCYVPSTQQNALFVLVWFQDSLSNKKLNAFDVMIEIQDNIALKLKAVSMSCTEQKINPLKESKYRQEVFDKLPEGDRNTTINGNRVYYTFEFISKEKIKSKQVDLSYVIEFLEGNQPNKKINLRRIKTCSFRIH